MPLDVAEQEFNENCFIAMLIVLILLNAAFLISNIITKKRQKKHDAKLTKLVDFYEKQENENKEKAKKQKKAEKKAEKLRQEI